MNIDLRPLGPELMRRRMDEISEALTPPAPDFRAALDRASGPSPLAGNIGRGPNPAAGPLAPLDPFSPGFTGGQTALKSLARSAAERHGVDPALFDALVQAESAYNPNARSGAGAMGLTQLMPATAAELGVTNPFDPAQNLDGGARYLRRMLDQFGDPAQALAAYNAGPARVRQYGGIPPFTETQNYVRRILGSLQTAEGPEGG